MFRVSHWSQHCHMTFCTQWAHTYTSNQSDSMALLGYCRRKLHVCICIQSERMTHALMFVYLNVRILCSMWSRRNHHVLQMIKIDISSSHPVMMWGSSRVCFKAIPMKKCVAHIRTCLLAPDIVFKKLATVSVTHSTHTNTSGLRDQWGNSWLCVISLSLSQSITQLEERLTLIIHNGSTRSVLIGRVRYLRVMKTVKVLFIFQHMVSVSTICESFDPYQV